MEEIKVVKGSGKNIVFPYPLLLYEDVPCSGAVEFDVLALFTANVYFMMCRKPC